MNYGIGRVRQRAVIIIRQSEALARKVAAKDTHARIDVIEKLWKIEMELQRLPQAFARFLFGVCTHQQIQRVAMITQQPGDQIAAEIAGRAGYEDRHKGSDDGALLGLAVAHAACAVQSSSRGARASNGRPSIRG